MHSLVGDATELRKYVVQHSATGAEQVYFFTDDEIKSLIVQFRRIFYPIEVYRLDISARAEHVLEALGIKTVGDLVQWTEAELLRAKNMGHTTVWNIKAALGDLGLQLKQ